MRKVGPLSYPGREDEIVDSDPSSLGVPAALVGLPLQLGAHYGREIGRVVAARREGGALIATFDVADPEELRALSPEGPQFSCEYTVTVDSKGIQRNPKFAAIAAVPASRCGSVCSVRADAARISAGARAIVDRELARLDARRVPDVDGDPELAAIAEEGGGEKPVPATAAELRRAIEANRSERQPGTWTLDPNGKPVRAPDLDGSGFVRHEDKDDPVFQARAEAAKRAADRDRANPEDRPRRVAKRSENSISLEDETLMEQK